MRKRRYTRGPGHRLAARSFSPRRFCAEMRQTPGSPERPTRCRCPRGQLWAPHVMCVGSSGAREPNTTTSYIYSTFYFAEYFSALSLVKRSTERADTTVCCSHCLILSAPSGWCLHTAPRRPTCLWGALPFLGLSILGYCGLLCKWLLWESIVLGRKRGQLSPGAFLGLM